MATHTLLIRAGHTAYISRVLSIRANVKGTPGSRSSNTLCPTHFLTSAWFCFMSFSVSCFYPGHLSASSLLPQEDRVLFSMLSRKSCRDCEEPAGNRCLLPSHLKFSSDIQQFQGCFRVKAKKKKIQAQTLCVKVPKYALSGKVFRITLG